MYTNVVARRTPVANQQNSIKSSPLDELRSHCPNSVDCLLTSIPRPRGNLVYYLEHIQLVLAECQRLMKPDSIGWIEVSDFIWDIQPIRDTVGSDRYRIKAEAGWNRTRADGSKYSETEDVQAAIAERYIADLLGCSFDGQAYLGGDSLDFRFQGYSVDVKWSRWDGDDAYLKVNPTDTPKNIYVLVTGDDMHIRGWATGKEVSMAPLKDWGYGAKRSLPASELHSFDRLLFKSCYPKPSEWALWPEQVACLLRSLNFYILKKSISDKNSLFCVSCTSQYLKRWPKPANRLDCLDLSVPHDGIVLDPFAEDGKTKEATEFSGHKAILIDASRVNL